MPKHRLLELLSKDYEGEKGELAKALEQYGVHISERMTWEKVKEVCRSCLSKRELIALIRVQYPWANAVALTKDATAAIASVVISEYPREVGGQLFGRFDRSGVYTVTFAQPIKRYDRQTTYEILPDEREIAIIDQVGAQLERVPFGTFHSHTRAKNPLLGKFDLESWKDANYPLEMVVAVWKSPLKGLRKRSLADGSLTIAGLKDQFSLRIRCYTKEALSSTYQRVKTVIRNGSI